MAQSTAVEKNAQDNKDLRIQKATFLKRCKSAKKVKLALPEIYETFLGKTYTFLLNGVPVTLYFDGEEHEYPNFIAKEVQIKLSKIMKSCTPKVKNEKIL